MTTSTKRLLTVADLEAFPEDDGNRYELIEGELFVSRAPGIPHQLVLHNVQIAFAEYLASNPCGRIVPGAGAIFSDYDAVIPDLAFVLNDRWDSVVANDRFIGALDIVIEIMSPGKQNRARDLTAKRRLYERFGIKEYWIVDAENSSVLTLRLQDESWKEIPALAGDDIITSPLLPEFEVKVNALFKI